MIWTRSTSHSVTADYLIEAAAVDSHEIPHLRCPRCAGLLIEWPGGAVYGDMDGSVLFWEQRHGCGARLRVLAPVDLPS